MLLLALDNEFSRTAIIHGWIGLIYRTLYKLQESQQSLEQAIEIFKETRTKHSLAIAYRELALTNYVQGE